MAKHAHTTPAAGLEPTPSGGRRSLFGAAAALLVAPAVVATAAPENPDAALIAASAEFVRLQNLWDCAGDSDPHFNTPEFFAVERERDRLGDLQRVQLHLILDHEPVTVTGLRALAAALASWDAELLTDSPGDTGVCLTAHLVGSLLAVGGAA